MTEKKEIELTPELEQLMDDMQWMLAEIEFACVIPETNWLAQTVLETGMAAHEAVDYDVLAENLRAALCGLVAILDHPGCPFVTDGYQQEVGVLLQRYEDLAKKSAAA